MKAPWRHSLLAKMLGWLALHLLVIAIAFAIFVGLQLRVGLDSLLSGRTGERLRDLGEVIGQEIRTVPRTEWSAILKRHSEARGLQIDLWHPPDNWQSGIFKKVPSNVTARLRSARMPQGRPQNPPPSARRPLGDDGFPPPPEDDPEGPPPDQRPPPDDREDFGPPEGRENFRGNRPPRNERPLPAAMPVFLLRGDAGDGYWAAVDMAHLPTRGGGQPQHALIVIRSDDLSGNGLLFETRPWIFGGFAVLALSVAFWAPFALRISRYVRRLTGATERIADGDFKVAVDSSRRDELGRLGSAVTEMAGRLDHLVSGQRRFLADVAHELCAPLARLRTGIAVLEQTVPEDYQPRLLSVEEDAAELARLIDEILAFSRAGAGRPQLREVALEPLSKEVADREGGDLAVSWQIEDGLTAHADPRLLSRAFGNLVRNVRIHAGPAAKLAVSGHRQGDHAIICFHDDGPGVPIDDLPRLFEPFYRPDRSRTRDTGGSGLGLAIVRSCIEACGGRVTGAVPSNGGFEVTVTLPVSPSVKS